MVLTSTLVHAPCGYLGSDLHLVMKQLLNLYQLMEFKGTTYTGIVYNTL